MAPRLRNRSLSSWRVPQEARGAGKRGCEPGVCPERHARGSGVETPRAAVLLGGLVQIASLRRGHVVDVTRMRKKTSEKPRAAGAAQMRARGAEVSALAGAGDHAYVSSPAVPTSPGSQGLPQGPGRRARGSVRWTSFPLCLDHSGASGHQDWATPPQAAPPRSAEVMLTLWFGVWGLYFCPQLCQPSAPQPPHLGPLGHAPSSAVGTCTPARPRAPIADLQTPCVTCG